MLRARQTSPIPSGSERHFVERWANRPALLTVCVTRLQLLAVNPRQKLGPGAKRVRPSCEQAHLLQEIRVALVALQTRQERVAFCEGEPAVVLDVGTFQPCEG